MRMRKRHRQMCSLCRLDAIALLTIVYVYSRSANVPEVHISTYNFIFFADISKIERAEVAC